MGNTTPTGREIIPVELVGQNLSLEFLQRPAKFAYPKGHEIQYSDDHLGKLNEMYVLGDILGGAMDDIAKAWGLGHIVGDSPLKNAEGESILGHMLANSARAEQWQPFVVDVSHLKEATSIKTAEDYLKKVKECGSNYHQRAINRGFLFGIAKAREGGFAFPIEHDNRVLVMPTQKFVEYIDSKK